MKSETSQSNTVTAAEAAEILSLSVFTVIRMVNRGVFSEITSTGYRSTGSKILIPRDEIEAYSNGEKRKLAELKKKRK